MTLDDPSRPTPSRDPRLARGRLRSVARRGLWVVARPYAHRRSVRADMLARLGRLESQVEQLGERNDEQIARLEGFARELVLTVESLRREIVQLAATVQQQREAAPRVQATPKGSVKR